MDRIDPPKPAPGRRGASLPRWTIAPEEMSLQEVPRIGEILREIVICIAVALGLALLATLYAAVMGGR